MRTCVVVAEERPRIALTQSFSKLFKDLGLHPRAVSTSLGCRVNLAICLQVGVDAGAARAPPAAAVRRALRADTATLRCLSVSQLRVAVAHASPAWRSSWPAAF